MLVLHGSVCQEMACLQIIHICSFPQMSCGFVLPLTASFSDNSWIAVSVTSVAGLATLMRRGELKGFVCWLLKSPDTDHHLECSQPFLDAAVLRML